MEIIFVDSRYRDTIECPFCSETNTVYKKTIQKDCQCIWKKYDDWFVYECMDCGKLYAVKK